MMVERKADEMVGKSVVWTVVWMVETSEVGMVALKDERSDPGWVEMMVDQRAAL